MGRSWEECPVGRKHQETPHILYVTWVILFECLPVHCRLLQPHRLCRIDLFPPIAGQSWPVDAGTLPIIKQQPQWALQLGLLGPWPLYCLSSDKCTNLIKYLLFLCWILVCTANLCLTTCGACVSISMIGSLAWLPDCQICTVQNNYGLWRFSPIVIDRILLFCWI